MTTLQALVELCLLLGTAGNPYEGHDVIINAHGVYQFIPSWDYWATVDQMCSLERHEEISEMQSNRKSTVAK